jgi:hypothetical protein
VFVLGPARVAAVCIRPCSRSRPRRCRWRSRGELFEDEGRAEQIDLEDALGAPSRARGRRRARLGRSSRARGRLLRVSAPIHELLHRRVGSSPGAQYFTSRLQILRADDDLLRTPDGESLKRPAPRSVRRRMLLTPAVRSSEHRSSASGSVATTSTTTSSVKCPSWSAGWVIGAAKWPEGARTGGRRRRGAWSPSTSKLGVSSVSGCRISMLVVLSSAFQ